MTTRHWQAGDDLAPQRVDLFLSQQLDLTRNQVQSWIRDGRVKIDGRPARPSSKVRPGDRVECELPPQPTSELVPSTGEVRVLVDDDSFFIIDKPAGLVVHPGAGTGADTLASRLLHLDPGVALAGSPKRPGIVHRLDRETTGVMAVARTDNAYRELSAAFAERRVVKVYLAIVHGSTAEEGRWSWPIGRHPQHRTRMTVSPGGRPAITDFRRLSVTTDAGLSLLALRLHTGRTHQIRVHLKAAGHPLVGDPVYGEARWRALPPVIQAYVRSFRRPALHAWYLQIPHPSKDEWVSALAPPAGDLVALWCQVSGQELPDFSVPLELSSRELPEPGSMASPGTRPPADR